MERNAAWLVLGILLALSYLLWQTAQRASLQEQRREFDSRMTGIGDSIQRRMAHYEQVLHSVRAFYVNQRVMERQEFSGYVAALEIDKNFPGIQGVSFAPLVPGSHKAGHVAAQRQSGLAEYAIRPEGWRAEYAPVAYIEPLTGRNARALGFDNLSSPVRKANIERARDEGRAVVSEKLVLIQEDGRAQQAGFLMFLPVFQRGAAHDTLAARRANIAGWFAASFRMDNLMAHIVDERAGDIELQVYDGSVLSDAARMYASPQGAGPAPLYSALLPLEIAGRTWTVRAVSLPEFEAKRDRSGERTAAIAGVAASLLLALATWLLLRDRRRAVETARAIGRELEMRRLAELRTKDLHMFNEAILEKSPFGIAVFRGGGSCVMANEVYAKAIGETVAEVLKCDFRNNGAWKRHGLLDSANQALETGLTIRRDIAGETTFGKQAVVDCIFAPISISGDPHLLLIMNDVSSRAETERALTESVRQLEKKELAKTRFLAAAGHDLRQPVAAASLFIDALKLVNLTPRQSEIIQRLDQSMTTFKGLLDALLNVSKLDAGIIKPDHIQINVAEVFHWLEQNFAPMAAGKSLRFRLYFPMKETLFIRSDIGLAKSVLMNLVSNAIKFTAQGAVLVSARRRGADVLFQVWDTGIGIAQPDIEHIFEEFYQIGNPQRDRTEGLGLGLAIARRGLTLLGRDIRCRSHKGRGSVFEFQLPMDAAAVEVAHAAAPGKEVAGESFAHGKRFVVVEDDALVAQAMVNWLEGMGGEVKCFHSGEEALRHATSIERADYFIADYMLGGKLNGIQFLNLVRQRLRRHINAVLVTGDTSTEFIRHAVDCDWLALHKPINTSQLISALDSQTRGASALR